MNTLREQHALSKQLVPEDEWDNQIEIHKTLINNELDRGEQTPQEVYQMFRALMVGEMKVRLALLGAAAYELKKDAKN